MRPHQISFKGDVQQHDDWTVKIDGSPVEVIKRGETEDTRYLGSFFNDKPKSSTTIEKLIEKVKNRLDLLTAANLPLRYEIVALSQWVASSCTDILLKEKTNLGHVDEIQLLINDSVRSWFRLPHNTNIEMVAWLSQTSGRCIIPFKQGDSTIKEYDQQAVSIIEDSLLDSAQARDQQQNFIGKPDIPFD